MDAWALDDYQLVWRRDRDLAGWIRRIERLLIGEPAAGYVVHEYDHSLPWHSAPDVFRSQPLSTVDDLVHWVLSEEVIEISVNTWDRGVARAHDVQAQLDMEFRPGRSTAYVALIGGDRSSGELPEHVSAASPTDFATSLQRVAQLLGLDAPPAPALNRPYPAPLDVDIAFQGSLCELRIRCATRSELLATSRAPAFAAVAAAAMHPLVYAPRTVSTLGDLAQWLNGISTEVIGHLGRMTTDHSDTPLPASRMAEVARITGTDVIVRIGTRTFSARRTSPAADWSGVLRPDAHARFTTSDHGELAAWLQSTMNAFTDKETASMLKPARVGFTPTGDATTVAAALLARSPAVTVWLGGVSTCNDKQLPSIGVECGPDTVYYVPE